MSLDGLVSHLETVALTWRHRRHASALCPQADGLVRRRPPSRRLVSRGTVARPALSRGHVLALSRGDRLRAPATQVRGCRWLPGRGARIRRSRASSAEYRAFVPTERSERAKAGRYAVVSSVFRVSAKKTGRMVTMPRRPSPPRQPLHVVRGRPPQPQPTPTRPPSR